MPAEQFRLAPHKLVHWWKRCLTPVAFRAPYSRIRILIGGIAQLVERQLCKLDVRGSNPLASKGTGVRQKPRIGRAALLDRQEAIPLPPEPSA